MIENKESSLEVLFEGHEFFVPPYQRAYAWEATQLQAFLSDLREYLPAAALGKAYFLGTILLAKDDIGRNGSATKSYAVVDGQQRLTTTTIFMASALARLSELGASDTAIAERFVGKRGCRPFRTIDSDFGFFDEKVLGQSSLRTERADSPSMKRLMEARQFFDKSLMHTSEKEIRQLLRLLSTSRILTYVVETASEATQIFEFQNDRGKRLTDLEALKSFLMHRLYLTGGAQGQTDGLIRAVHGIFTELYRCMERIEGNYDAPNEDAILGFHCIAFEPWEKIDENRDGWRHPKELIRKLLTGLPKNEEKDWIVHFSERLRDTFKLVQRILEASNKHPALGGLFILRRITPYWPLLIKCWEADRSDDQRDFKRVAGAVERFAFRSSVAGVRSDTGVEYFRRDLANKFSVDFDGLVAEIDEMSKTSWNLENRFLQSLDNPNFYETGAPARYLLWRYENSLREGSGNQTRSINWGEMVGAERAALQFTVDHIISQNPSDEAEQNLLETDARWLEGDRSSAFKDVFLNRLGNLVLSTRSKNASKGNRPFADRELLDPAGCQHSELEWREFASHLDGTPVWDEESIRKRHMHLRSFAWTL